MLALDVTVGYRRRRRAVTALVDTGTSVGLVLPMELAQVLGAVLVESASGAPVSFGGVEIPGFATVLRVGSPTAGLAPVETPVWVPEVPSEEVLLGAYWLGQVGASLRVGTRRLSFAIPTRRNPRAVPLDPATFPWHLQRIGLRWPEMSPRFVSGFTNSRHLPQVSATGCRS